MLAGGCGRASNTSETSGASTSTGSTSADVSGGVSAPDRATVAAWPGKWCQLQYGMTRRQTRSIMGPPTNEFLGPNAQQDEWSAYQYDFVAFYSNRVQVTDPMEQTARQLEADPSASLSSADRAAIPCALTRGAPGETFPGAP